MTSKTLLLPSHPHGAKLAQIFNYGWRWLETSPDRLDADWKTNAKYPLKPRTLWTYWQDAARIIGTRFGSSTSYAMLDIDKNSRYLDQVREISQCLETIGIVRTIPVRSSWSGGVHLYIPLPKSFPTFSVACALKQILEAHGYHIAPGHLEVFPNEKPYGKSWMGEFYEYNGHRLPLQPGSGSILVDADLEPIPSHDQLSRFLALWDNAVQCNDAQEIGEALAMARANRRRRRGKGGLNGTVAKWKQDLETVIQEGWTGPGQTNALLKDIACYGVVFEHLRGHALMDYIEKMATNAPGFEQHCDHQYEIHRRAAEWARSAQTFWWPIGDLPLRGQHASTDVGVNEYRRQEARHRITEAMRVLKHQALGIRELAQQLVQEARCSLQTLYKHLDLWHPSPGCVTAQPEGVSAEMEAIRQQIIESLETLENTPVTHPGGGNEVCSLKSLLKKSLPPGGKEGGAGGRKGLSTGWRPPLDWQPGAVGDCHA
jgi:hypothetical protein